MSASEPETPKPNAVDQEVTNALENLTAENEKLRQEDAQTKRQYMDLLENSAATIGNLKKELEEARSQLATVQGEKEVQEQAATENTRYYAGVMNEAGANLGILKKELEEARSELAAGNQKISDRDTEIEQLKSKIQTLQSKPPEPEQQPAPAIDLSEKAWDVYSVVKPWLVPKAPKSLRSDIEEKLKPKED